MSNFENKIDFALVISVKNANPNGDPLNGNRPRINYDSTGEISDVCIKRKLRNRLMQEGKNVFVQMNENKVDEYGSLSERFTAAISTLDKKATEKEKAAFVCSEWIDVRAFGQVFAFKATEDKGVSMGIRGPVSIHPAFSVEPINATSIQITKSVNSEPVKGGGKSSDTMGMKHRVDFGVYITYGSINVELASKTGFNADDAEDIKNALMTLFRNDASSARPEGSMAVEKLIWWKHNNASGQYSSAKVHKSLKVSKKDEAKDAFSIDDYNITVESLDGLEVEVLYGE
jgi:CRISPR-associated protein Csd2